MALRLLVTAQGDAQGRTFRYDFDDDRAQILLGRRGGVDVLLPHALVSLVHARIERRGGGYVVVDEHSTNGTSVNGAPLAPGEERALAQGDRVGIAEFELEVAEVEPSDGGGAAESSLSIARRMVQEVLGVLGPGEQHPAVELLDHGAGGGAIGGGGDGGSSSDVRGATATATARRLELAEPGRAYVVGREPGCDLLVDDATVSREHVRLVRGARGDVTASDLGSSHGLYVNDRFVAGERVLRDGDVLSVGRARLRFVDAADVYLQRLEEVATPAARAPAVTPRTVAAPGPSRAAPAAKGGDRADGGRRWGERVAVMVGALVALLAAASLVYLWMW